MNLRPRRSRVPVERELGRLIALDLAATVPDLHHRSDRYDLVDAALCLAGWP
jgi:hypothetical protein